MRHRACPYAARVSDDATAQPHPLAPSRPKRLLLVLPSWVGDCVMATPAIARIRAALPGACIGALARPGMDDLLDGDSLIDEFHVGRASGVMSYKHLAAKLRPLRYDTVLLFTNSFSTALVVRLASIPQRIGFARDARGLLLTHALHPPRNPDGSWGLISAVDYYWLLADALLGTPSPSHAALMTSARQGKLNLPEGHPMRLGVTPQASARATSVLQQAGLLPPDAPPTPFALLNPGGNNPAKRWPPANFAQLADALHERCGLATIINGSPGEVELCDAIAQQCKLAKPIVLARACMPEALRLSELKAIVARASLMVTNDTGPRHIAAALGVPLVSLFGPTDARWTTIPPSPRGGSERVLLADSTLPEAELANDHPQRCAIEHISLDAVLGACLAALSERPQAPTTISP